MKKRCIVVFLCCFSVFPVLAELPLSQGYWKAEPWIVEDELLIDSEASYFYPYTGFTGLEIIDEGLLIMYFQDNKYQAFYDVEQLDFDNVRLTFQLKNGETSAIKLVKTKDGFKYLFRVAKTSIIASNLLPPTAEDAQTGAATNGAAGIATDSAVKKSASSADNAAAVTVGVAATGNTAAVAGKTVSAAAVAGNEENLETAESSEWLFIGILRLTVK